MIIRKKISNKFFVYYNYKNLGSDKCSLLLFTKLLKVSTRYLNNCGNAKSEK